MSQIFDALRRSEAERAGIDLAELSNATDLLQAAERKTAATTAPNVVAALESAQRQLNEPALQPEFESLPVSIAPESRLVSLTDKESLAAEKFRLLGVRLRHLQQVKPLKKVLITSAIPSEGKSMVASNLACTLASKKQQKVLLLDGDLRRPMLARQFGLGHVSGLSEWLQCETGAMTNIYYLESAGLWILPAGTAPQDPLELMQTGMLSALIGELAARFDWIIVDSPPILPLADTSVWARLVDGIILVARQGTSEKRHLKKGLEALDQAKLLGTLINASQDVANNNYYYYRYASKTSSQKVTQQK